jgi:DNA-directed RNA polymerase sigma subunit (sigma70/sigma32)
VRNTHPALAEVIVTESDREALERIVHMKTSEQRAVLRARIVLLSATGQPDRVVAQQLGVNRHTVRLWRKRFCQEAWRACRTLRDAAGNRC